jgi:hypothetical protein
MSRLGINTGSNPNDGQGDPLRVAMGKINSNFLEIYNTVGDGFTLTSYASTAGISSLARNLTGSPRITVGGILNTGITTTEHIEVRNIKSTGIVTAVQFIGDGSQLTNVTAVAGGLEVLDDNVRKGVARELNFGENIISTGPDVVGRVTISVPNVAESSAYSETSGISSYADVAGFSSESTNSINAGFADTSNVSNYSFSSGISTYSDISGISTESLISGYADISGVSTVSFGFTGTPNIVVGIITADSYEGSGSRLTGIITTLIAGTNISILQSAGIATINAVGGGATGGGVAYDQELNTTDDVTFNNLNISGVATVTQNVVAQFYDIKDIGSVGYGGTYLQITANSEFDIITDASGQGEGGPIWRFGTDGTLTAPGNIIVPYYEVSNIGTIGAASTSLLLNANSSLVVRTNFSGLGVGGPVWVFNANGSLAAPGNLNVSGNASISGVVTATRFESLPSGTPTIGAATSIKLDTITVGVSTDLNVGRNVNVSGVVTSTGGFISVGNTTPIKISLVGNKLTFTAVGIGSTTLTLF